MLDRELWVGPEKKKKKPNKEGESEEVGGGGEGVDGR